MVSNFYGELRLVGTLTDHIGYHIGYVEYAIRYLSSLHSPQH